MKKFLKKILFGTSFPQEYLCLDLNEFSNPLKLLTKTSSGELKDITNHHLFNGYKPVLFSLNGNVFDNNELSNSTNITISFLSNENHLVAKLSLKLIAIEKIDSTTCLVYEGLFGKNYFQNVVHHSINNLRYKLTSDRKKNIFLAGNLFDQVKIAYSVPRKIFLITVESERMFNVFPTDLSGKISEDIFIVSLRKGGRANQQIEQAGFCIVSKMAADSFEEVYRAGKNHMKELSDISNLGVSMSKDKSKKLNLPVPSGAVKYFELQRIKMIEAGIHNLHFFRNLNSVSINDNSSVLAHIYRDYAEWRKRHGIISNYLMRKIQ